MRGNLNDNQAKIDNADKAVRAALERKRKIIMQSKQIAYDTDVPYENVCYIIQKFEREGH